LVEQSCHFALWYNGHGETTEVIVSPGITGLIGDTIHLSHATLESLTLAFLTEVYDRMTRRLNEINLDLVVGVLDDCGGHVVCPVLMNIV
jgi:environmental stress-induced protein Ves